MGLIWPKLLAPDVGGGIEFVGGNIAGKAGATSGNSTMSLTSGLTGGIASSVSDDDLVIAAYGTVSTANRTLTITDGSSNYTLIDSELYINDVKDTNLRVAYKFVSGDTATTFGPTGNVAEAGATAVYVFRGVDLTTPLDVAAVSATAANGGNANPPSITPSTAGAFIVAVGASGFDSGTSVFTTTDLTDFLSQNSTDSDNVNLGIGHKDDWTSGPFDPAQWTNPNSDTDASWAAITIALRPA